MWNSHAASLTVALAVGLLIGLDREKQKDTNSLPEAAGVRTFALVALLGAMAALAESEIMAAILGAGAVALNVLFSYTNRLRRPSETTAFALLATFAIGFLAVQHVEMAAAIGVLIVLLLSSKSRLHKFALSQLTGQELRDATLLAGAALIVLPLLPDRTVDPLGVINLRVIWRLTILMLLINALGYIARRTAGERVGLAITGFCAGFVSSILTIAAMGRQARREPSQLHSAVAGASFSSIATAIELLIILSMTNVDVLRCLAPGIAAMGLFAAAYGLGFALKPRTPISTSEAASGRAFEPKLAFLFAGAFALMLFVAALLQKHLGSTAAQTTIALAGFFDTHAAAASAARLASSGTLSVASAAFAALLAITANTLVKAATALVTGGWSFASRVCPSHAGMLIVLWGGWLLVQIPA
jgi:uncharacterized membrane protein (DUF4010 family)